MSVPTGSERTSTGTNRCEPERLRPGSPHVPTYSLMSPPPTPPAWLPTLIAFCSVGLLSTSMTHDQPDARPATQVTQLSCQPLADVPGKSMTTAIVHFPPGAFTPAHRHPGSVTAYVVSGSIRSQLDGTPPTTFSAGSTWYEPPGALHLFAENASSIESAELLAVFVTDHDCGPLVIPEPLQDGSRSVVGPLANRYGTSSHELHQHHE